MATLKTITANCQIITLNKNQSQVRFVIPGADEKKPAGAFILVFSDPNEAKGYEVDKDYTFVISENSEA